MRLVALIALVACGSSADPPPSPKAAPAPVSPTMLAAAAGLAKTPADLIALARVDVARGDDATLQATLARIQPGRDAVAQLALADLRGRLDDTTTAAVQALDTTPELLPAALIAVEGAPARALVIAAIARSTRFDDVIDDLASTGDLVPATPTWDAIVAAVGDDLPKRVSLASTARRLHASAVASALAHAAAKTGTGFELASELALDGDAPRAREVGERRYTRAHGYWVEPGLLASSDQVLDALDHAVLEAMLGDVAASKSWETKAPTLARPNLTFLENHGGQTFAFEHEVNCFFAIAEALRHEPGEARGHIRELPADAVPSCLVHLAELGGRDLAVEMAVERPGPVRARAAEYLVHLDLLRGDLAKAQELAVQASGGLEPVLLAYARRGDVAATTAALALDTSPTAPVTQLVTRMRLAWSLARQKKCDLARPLANELGNAITFAIVARYCPP